MLQPSIPSLPAGTDLSGKTVIVTGGNTGIGYGAAKQFLTLNASRVIITSRSRTKGEEAVSQLRNDPDVQKTKGAGTVEMMELELDDYQSVVAFARKVKAEVSELDVLLCNAGVTLQKFETSKSGHERIMQVNCYSHFLLVLELLPMLRSTALKRGTPSHLTFVSSSLQTRHGLGKVHFQASDSIYGHFDDPKMFSWLTRYNDSKLAVAAFCHELAERVPASEAIINHVCPGLVSTGLDKNLSSWIKGFMFVVRKIGARTVDVGARTLVHASYVKGAETHGKFVSNNKIEPNAPYLDEPAGRTFSKNLWSETIQEVNKLDPDLKSLPE